MAKVIDFKGEREKFLKDRMIFTCSVHGEITSYFMLATSVDEEPSVYCLQCYDEFLQENIGLLNYDVEYEDE